MATKTTANTNAGCGLLERMGEVILSAVASLSKPCSVRRDVACNVSLSMIRNAGGRDAAGYVSTTTRQLMHRSLRTHTRVELDLPESALVAPYVLLEKAQQRLSLLRAQINSLEVLDLHLGFCLLLQRAKDQEEVPNIDSHLHAVGIILAVAGVVG